MTIVVRPKKALSPSSPPKSPPTATATASSRRSRNKKNETTTASSQQQHQRRRRKQQQQQQNFHQQDEEEEEYRSRTSKNSSSIVITTMPVSPRPKRSSVNPLLLPSTTTTNKKQQPIPSLPSLPQQQLKPMSISTGGSAHESNNNNNPSSSCSSLLSQQQQQQHCCSPRIKKFQICMWVTLVLAFIHLISKPPSIDVTSPEDHGKQIKKTTTTTTTTTKDRDTNNNDKHGHSTIGESRKNNNKSTDATDTTTSNNKANKRSPTPRPTPMPMPTPAPTPTSKLKGPTTTDEQPQYSKSQSQSQSQSKPTTPAPASATVPEKPSTFEKKNKETKNTKSSSAAASAEKTTKTAKKTAKKDKKHTPTPSSPTLSPPLETNSSSSTTKTEIENNVKNAIDDKDNNNDDSSGRDKSKKGDDYDGGIITTTTQPTTTTTKESSASSPSPLPTTSPTPPKILDPSSFSVLPPKTSKDVSDISRQFVEKHCDMKGFNNPSSTADATVKSWYPSQDVNIWQQRAPYFIVAGVWNSGINDLSRTLLKFHPQIIPSKIPGFFLPKQFQHYYKLVPTSSTSSPLSTSSKVESGSIVDSSSSSTITTASTEVSNVKVFAARNKMYASVYSRSALRYDINDNSSSNNNTLVAMDVSPGLIFYAHTTAHSILCVAPWSKIVVLLRNPIDRVYKQWLYSKTNLGLTLSLEDWMAQEMQLMHDVGLIDAVSYGMKATTESGQEQTTAAGGGGGGAGDTENDNGEKTVVVPEREAWNKYQAVRGMPKSIGRSLYVLQLEEWINTFKEAGMNPSEEMIVLLSEEVEAHPQEQYTKLFQFLGLGPVGITSPVRTPAPATADPIKPETREMLKTFFRPYNRRLEKLLKENGFEGDWEKLWK